MSDSTETDVTLTLDLLKEVRFQFEPTEWGATTRSLVDEHAQSMSVALGDYIADALATLWGDTYTQETIKATTAVDYSTIVAIVKVMNSAGVPEIGRWACVSSAVAESLRNDEMVMEHFDRNRASGYAHWVNLEGFKDIWEYPALPGTDNTTGFFASKSACVAAGRLLADPADLLGLGYPGTLSVVTEPITGFSVLKNTYVTQAALQVGTRLIVLAGVDEGQLLCGHRLVTA